MSTSPHLQEIIARHHQVSGVQAVFVDIADYSKRRTQSQVKVLDTFSRCLQAALKSVSQRYVTYAQANSVNFATDVVKLPTGDGAVIGFTFGGLHDVHLKFALEILAAVRADRQGEVCERYDADGWCNCHDFIDLRIGIADGKAIVFRDVNDHYNLAGSVINTAARVMNLMNPGQVGFTQGAYEQLIDLVDEPNMADHFRLYEGVEVKHGLKLNVAQYIDADLAYLDSGPTKRMTNALERKEIIERMRTSMAPFNMPVMKTQTEEQEMDQLRNFETIGSLLGVMVKSMISTDPPGGEAAAMIRNLRTVSGEVTYPDEEEPETPTEPTPRPQ